MVTPERGQKFADNYKFQFHKTSARMNVGVDDCMNDIIEKTIQYKNKGKNFNKSSSVGDSMNLGSFSTQHTIEPDNRSDRGRTSLSKKSFNNLGDDKRRPKGKNCAC